MNFHKKVLIGILFQFFDLNLGPVDVIPDFIGFLFIASAFSDVKARYASLGVATSSVLAVVALIEIFYPQLQQMTAYFPLQIVSILIGAVTVLYFGCIFSVSKDVVGGEERMFPTVFISAQLLVSLFTSIGLYFDKGMYEGFMIVAMLLLLCFYVYFIVFLWQRKNKEQALEEISYIDSD